MTKVFTVSTILLIVVVVPVLKYKTEFLAHTVCIPANLMRRMYVFLTIYGSTAVALFSLAAPSASLVLPLQISGKTLCGPH